MPGDTLIVTSTGDSLKLPDSLFYQAVQAHSGDSNSNDEVTFFLAMAVFLFIIALPFFVSRLMGRYHRQQALKIAIAELSSHAALYDGWLSAYNSYYKSLPAHLRQRFLERVVTFMETKTFDYIDIAAEDKMPLLISAASVQITFGLDKYLLDFFDTIHVLKHDYQYGGYSRPFMGHVSQAGIYLSWDNFLRGFEDYTDANNVGIHEMAHALAYVNFMAEANDGEDDAFKKRFHEFSAVARPVFNDMQNGATNMLDNYAATNYNEFWAVAVENFFEKPLQMKTEMPQLYVAMSYLLNQDPLLPEKILNV